jgi:hypothetical protein
MILLFYIPVLYLIYLNHMWVARSISASRAKKAKLSSTAPIILCVCTACKMNSVSPYMLTQKARTDGAGAFVQHILFGMAAAAHYQWNFGGLEVPLHRRDNHNVSMEDILNVLFGNASFIMMGNTLSLLNESASSLKSFETFEDLESFHHSNTYNLSTTFQLADNLQKKSQLIYYKNIRYPDNPSHFTSSFLNSLRQTFHCGLSRFLASSTIIHYFPLLNQNLPTLSSSSSSNRKATIIAMHLRLGDAVYTEARQIPLSWSAQILFELQTLLTAKTINFQIHLFSSLLSKNITFERHLLDSFSSIENLNVHVDYEQYAQDNTRQVLTTWTHLIAADVFIMAKSSFSYVPAIYNEHCVLYYPFWHRPLAHWIKLPAFNGSIQNNKALQLVMKDEVLPCMERL